MTRLVHLTDLHFGIERPELVEPLHHAVVKCRPDLVVVSGDLTHRARRKQFRQAMAFLHRLNLPFLPIPGNHDVPLHNFVARALNPFGAYRRAVSQGVAPIIEVGNLRLFGTNTAAPWRWRRGILRRHEIDRICAEARTSPEDVVNILVHHHPLEEPPGFERGETRNARELMEKMIESGITLALSGHLHNWSVGLGITPGTPRALFQMQTGTALCGRHGETNHGFAVMDFDGDLMTITPFIVDETTLLFTERPPAKFTRREGLWQPAG
ncbi:MAG: metallophosphoesterase [Cereibacter sphaeroides]|uniref:Metallophosphoesterase n=1 Tax=Cereibacter sphaeroides TaxID=1063 RepID=A0A2W5SIB1_CERSP|nr:MAG: metallophosphoesterase [Cereibacter sphaeroides]